MMACKTKLLYVFFILFCSCIFVCCKSKHAAVKKEIVKKPEEMDDQVSDNIAAVLRYAKDNKGKINDSIRLSLPGIVASFYDNNDFHGVWSKKEKWAPLADSMFYFIEHCRYYGLYPSDYHFKELSQLREKLVTDTLAGKDAITWTKADLMLTDAFMKTARDLKEGRILPDSVSIIKKEKYIDSFFISNLTDALKRNSLSDFFTSIEPTNNSYVALKKATSNFVDKMDTIPYRYIMYPQPDSAKLVRDIKKRLLQSGIVKSDSSLLDSVSFSNELKKYQRLRGIRKDGKISTGLIDALNNNDREKFKRLAITLDRYKLLPDTLPQRYIWVNLPGFYLQLCDSDSVIVRSKVIVGKPTTPTPTLTSSITDMVTYPQWTIPESIIKKDILPALKKDPGYLARKGFNLVDSKGDVVDPYTITWSKYIHGIPWKIMQGSGDDNALGIFKFNFNNPYSVYLHDTNQRYLFQNSDRALSHGCVRVQKWQDIAFYIARNDSLNKTKDQKLAYTVDSIKTWLTNKDRKRIFVKNRLPLFIEYFSCEARNDKIIFYKDIYNADRELADKYFANK